ncbi:phosphatidylinositol-3,5-bisphosphate 5-phosphatase [Rhizophlyctis rosea]|nr:phosphatidylinositol-3,5-bisphosphate 5-phosphatase [Rhizophlyctis rosea]
MNLFLGHFVPDERGPHLWDLPTDYFLHNETPRKKRTKRSYVRWWTPDAFAQAAGEYDLLLRNSSASQDDYFLEYYRPKIYTTFGRLFAFNMISTSTRMWKEDVVDPSPFTVRANLSHIAQPARPNQGPRDPRYLMIYSLNIGGVKRWLTLTNKQIAPPGAENGKNGGDTDGRDSQSREKEASVPWWTTSALATRLLDPQVPHSELKEYKRYEGSFMISPRRSRRMPTESYLTRYINQFRASSIQMMPVQTDGNPTQEAESSHPDYKIFASYVGRVDGTASSYVPDRNVDGGVVDGKVEESRDHAMYSAYVESVSVEKASSVWGTLGRTKADMPRYEAYAKWLSTGKFVSSRNKTAKVARA